MPRGKLSAARSGFPSIDTWSLACRVCGMSWMHWVGSMWMSNRQSVTIIFRRTTSARRCLRSPRRHHMDGETALRFARTRYADDDLARVGRQQKVLTGSATPPPIRSTSGDSPEHFWRCNAPPRRILAPAS